MRWPPTANAEPTRSRDADDFVHLLLGVASLGEAIERLAESAPAQRYPGSRGRRRPDSIDYAVAPMTAALARSDFLRAPVLATARPEGFKEWHHFVVHGQGCRLLINFSLTNETVPRRSTPAGATRHRDRSRRAMDRRHRAVRRPRHWTWRPTSVP